MGAMVLPVENLIPTGPAMRSPLGVATPGRMARPKVVPSASGCDGEKLTFVGSASSTATTPRMTRKASSWSRIWLVPSTVEGSTATVKTISIVTLVSTSMSPSDGVVEKTWSGDGGKGSPVPQPCRPISATIVPRPSNSERLIRPPPSVPQRTDDPF